MFWVCAYLLLNQCNMDRPFYFGLSSYRQCVTQFLVLWFEVDFGIDAPYFESSDGMGDSLSKLRVKIYVFRERRNGQAASRRQVANAWPIAVKHLLLKTTCTIEGCTRRKQRFLSLSIARRSNDQSQNKNYHKTIVGAKIARKPGHWRSTMGDQER